MNTRPIRYAGLMLLLLAAPAFANPPEKAKKAEPAAQEGIEVPKPPFSEGIFPLPRHIGQGRFTAKPP